MTQLPPWLYDDWVSLFQRFEKDRVPHALLIEGTDGIGKSLFAEHIAKTFLCTNASLDGSCGMCTPCQLFQAGTHPDFTRLTPVDSESNIKVDAVRELISWLQLTPQYDSYKLAIVTPADSMNRNAANSLLKTLEEPASQDLILLTTDSAGSLPATIRSRCQRIHLRVREPDIALDWLAAQGVTSADSALSLAGGGPLLAATMNHSEWLENRQRLSRVWQDILLGKASIARSVEAISDLPTTVCLSAFASWVADITKLRADINATIRNQDVRETLVALRSCLCAEDWFTLYDQLLTLNRIDSASFKTQTVLEGIFADIRLKQSV